MSESSISGRRTPQDERRREIVACAAKVFEERGFSTTTMESIAQSVGLAKPTLYHYFSSKDDILFAIHDEFIDLLIDKQRDPARAEQRPNEQLRGVINDVIGLMGTHRGHVRVFFEHYREMTPAHQSVIRAKRDEYEKAVTDLFRAGMASGEIRPVDPQLATLALFGMTNWTYQWFRPEGTLSAAQMADEFYGYLFDGLAEPPVLDSSISPDR